jgi:hypothetical protein
MQIKNTFKFKYTCLYVPPSGGGGGCIILPETPAHTDHPPHQLL